MDAFTTPGAISWSELTTSDPKAAAEFYSALFGWTVNAMDMGAAGEYRVVKMGEAMIGGICAPAPDDTRPPNWGSYVTVENVDKSVEKCLALGGKVLVRPMDVPTVGRMALIQDPQGALISVITYDQK